MNKKFLISTIIFIIINIISQWFWYIKKNFEMGLLLFIISLIYIIIYRDEINKIKTKEVKIKKAIEMFLFIIIFLFGVFLRFLYVDQFPYNLYIDEAQNGKDALAVINNIKLPYHNTYLPVYGGHPMKNEFLFVYICSIFIKFLGIGALQVRLPSIIIGILTIPAIYFLIRSQFGSLYALIGAFILSVLRWHLHFSRISFHAIFSVLTISIFLYFFLKLIKNNNCVSYYILSGFTLALNLYTYRAARLLIFFISIFGIMVLFYNKKYFINNYRKILVMLGIFFISYLPMLNYIFHNYDQFMGRNNSVSIFNKESVRNWLKKDIGIVEVLKYNILKTILIFNFEGDHNPRHNLHKKPQLDFFTGIFFIYGLFLSLISLNWQIYMLILLLLIFLQAGILSIDAPHCLRIITVIPLVIIFSIYYIKRIVEIFISYNREFLKVIIIIISIICTYIAWENIYLFFCIQKQDSKSWREFSAISSNAVRLVKTKRNCFFILSNDINDWTFQYLLYNDRYKNYNFDDFLDLKKISEKIILNKNLYNEFCLIITPVLYNFQIDRIKDFFKNIEIEEFTNRYDKNEKIFYIIKVKLK